GATYHRSAAARDRDKIRQQVLENLGWTIFRVWSADWWYDSDSAVERLHEALTERLEADRSTSHDAEDLAVEDTELSIENGIVDVWDSVEESAAAEPPVVAAPRPLISVAEPDSGLSQPRLFARAVAESERRYYQPTELPDVSS